MLLFYTLFLMIFSIMILIVSDDRRGRINIIGGLLMYLPLYGRILGWW